MTIETADPTGRRTTVRVLLRVLMRAVALCMFALGLLYWVRLIGIVDGALWRFDLMPLGWRIAAPALAVLYPVGGTGLWMGASWGLVVWALVAGAATLATVSLPPATLADTFAGPVLLGVFALAAIARLASRISVRRSSSR